MAQPPERWDSWGLVQEERCEVIMQEKRSRGPGGAGLGRAGADNNIGIPHRRSLSGSVKLVLKVQSQLGVLLWTPPQGCRVSTLFSSSWSRNRPFLHNGIVSARAPDPGNSSPSDQDQGVDNLRLPR